MNFLEIFNKTMLELNFRPIAQFENIYKNEHLRILENIKRVNSEVCTSHNWDFLKKDATILLPAHSVCSGFEVTGRVYAVYENGQKLAYNPKAEDFLTGAAQSACYGAHRGKLIFPRSSKIRKFKVFYSSAHHVVDEMGQERDNFVVSSDVSKIPDPYCEEILVYGACIKTKANPSFPKFAFWNSAFNRAIARMRSELCPTCEEHSQLMFTFNKNKF